MRGSAAVLLVAGCAPASPLYLAPPEPAAARIIAVRERTDAAFTVSAAPGEAPLFVAIGGFPAEIVVLSYPAALAELGLVPGPLAPGAGSCRLLEPAATHQLRLSSGVPTGTWTQSEIPDALAPAIAGDCAGRCWDLASRLLGHRPADMALLAEAREGAVWILYGDRSSIRVTAEGTVEELCPPGEQVTAAALSGDERWLGTADGRVLRGSVRSPGCASQEVLRLDAPAAILALATSAPGEAEELFVLSATGAGDAERLRLSRWDGATWGPTLDLERPRTPISRSGIVRLGPGTAVAYAGRAELYTLRDAETAVVPVDPTLAGVGGAQVESLAPDPAGQGVWCGVRDVGPVLFALPDRWRASVVTGYISVPAVIPAGDRVLFSHGRGLIGQRLPSGPDCPGLAAYEPPEEDRRGWSWLSGAMLDPNRLVIAEHHTLSASNVVERQVVLVERVVR